MMTKRKRCCYAFTKVWGFRSVPRLYNSSLFKASNLPTYVISGAGEKEVALTLQISKNNNNNKINKKMVAMEISRSS